MKKIDLKTGMMVKTAEGKYFYVIQDWLYKDEETEQYKLMAMLMAADREDEQVFYGFLNYDQDLRLLGNENSEWNIVAVYIFAGADLNMMAKPERKDLWVELNEPAQISQEVIERYLTKFEE